MTIDIHSQPQPDGHNSASQAPQPAWEQSLVWSAAAEQLVGWTGSLVNRTDVFGRYLQSQSRAPDRGISYTAPAREQRLDGALTREIVLRHYCGATQGDLIGLHAISRDNSSRWFVVDIDKHDREDGATLAANFQAAIAWWNFLRGLGFSPLLLDSNGKGGFHLMVLFKEPTASSVVFNFARWLIRDYQKYGLQSAPETFPKQPAINAQRPYGSWWRLPGRHHSRDHWTKVWNGAQWLEGNAAIAALIAAQCTPVSLIPPEVLDWVSQPVDLQRLAKSAVGAAEASEWIEILRGKPEGGRHNSLARLAGHLLGHRLPAVEVEELCLIWNSRNSPPLPEAEIRSTVHDIAVRHEQKQPFLNRPRTILRLSQ